MTNPAPVTLTTPCSINQLIDFIEHQVKPTHENLETTDTSKVTTTTTTIVVA
jgi:hypothetical protein